MVLFYGTLSTKGRPDCARKTGWIRVKMLSLVFGERGSHVFEGGHRVDAKKREPWGQRLLKLGASFLEFLFLWVTESVSLSL